MPNLALTVSPLCTALVLFPVGEATWPREEAIEDPGLSTTATESANGGEPMKKHCSKKSTDLGLRTGGAFPDSDWQCIPVSESVLTLQA